MTNEQRLEWDADMQERVFGASPRDDYNFKTRTFPKYTTDVACARRLVDAINQSDRFRIAVEKPGPEFSVEVRDVREPKILSSCRGSDEAAVICEAIMTADVKL